MCPACRGSFERSALAGRPVFQKLGWESMLLTPTLLLSSLRFVSSGTDLTLSGVGVTVMERVIFFY